jgi:hypothetical protein
MPLKDQQRIARRDWILEHVLAVILIVSAAAVILIICLIIAIASLARKSQRGQQIFCDLRYLAVSRVGRICLSLNFVAFLPLRIPQARRARAMPDLSRPQPLGDVRDRPVPAAPVAVE